MGPSIGMSDDVYNLYSDYKGFEAFNNDEFEKEIIDKEYDIIWENDWSYYPVDVDYHHF